MLTTKKQLAYSIVLLLLCLSDLSPVIKFHQTGIKIVDFITAFGIFYFFITFFISYNHRSVFYNSIFVLWFFIIFHGVILGILNNYDFFDKFYFPTEMWQYAKRMLYFTVAYYISRRDIITSRIFFEILILSLLLIELVGIIQIYSTSFGHYLASFYTRTDAQLILLIERSHSAKRIFGVAGFSNAWGAFSVFAFCVSTSSLFLKKTSGYREIFHFVSSILLLCFSLLNIWFSSSRGAILALLFVIISLVIITFFTSGKSINILLKCFSLFLLLSVFGWIYLHYFDQGRLNTIIYRFNTLYITLGGARVDQILLSLSLLTGPYELFFGIGNLAQRTYGVSFGAESEPFFLLINYGITGFFLRYLLIFFIAKHAYHILANYQYHNTNYPLALAALLSFVGYLSFSFTYFFFHELYIGTMPWLLFGWVYGIERYPQRVALMPLHQTTSYTAEEALS